jgi:1-acyl-sn-glycerol-3-phosphate acyltransferase
VEAGLLSLLPGIVVAPLLRLLPVDHERDEVRIQNVIHRLTSFYLRGLGVLGAYRVECANPERLRKPGILVVANHPTLLDAWALMSRMPQADCIVKERYYDNPFLGGTARRAGYIPSRDGPGLVEACVERLRRGRSLIIFPEGTRSPVDRIGPFARGAAHIALRSGCDVVPVMMRCEPATLYHGRAWWDVPDRTPILTMDVGDPLRVDEIVDPELNRSRAARALTASLRDHFKRELAGV